MKNHIARQRRAGRAEQKRLAVKKRSALNIYIYIYILDSTCKEETRRETPRRLRPARKRHRREEHIAKHLRVHRADRTRLAVKKRKELERTVDLQERDLP